MEGNQDKSGGIATNIGIHFFDLLIWLFGSVQKNEVHLYEKKKAGGFLELENAYVQWFLSIDRDDLPINELTNGAPTFRSITVENEEIKFSGGFSDLHTNVYKETLSGNGFGIDDSRPSIELVYRIRKTPISNGNGNVHHMIKKYLKKHAFIPTFSLLKEKKEHSLEIKKETFE